MANLKDLFNQPTKPALRDGAHKMILTSVEIPEVTEDKTPYVILTFKDLDNQQTYSKYMFENDLGFFSRSIKELFDIAETDTPLNDLCDRLLSEKTEIPVFIHTVTYKSMQDDTLRTTKNWYFVTDYNPTENNIQASSER